MFLVNYFRAMVSPVSSFMQRHYLNIWQKILILLMLNSLLLMPISLAIGRQNRADLKDYMPQAMTLLDETLVTQLNDLTVKEEQLVIDDLKILKDEASGIVGLAPSSELAQTALNGKSGIMFTPREFYMKEEGRGQLTQAYLLDSRLTSVTTVEDLQKELSRQWFESNRLSIVLTNFINTGILLLVSFLGLILGSSLFLYLTKFSRMYSIQTFSEAFTVCLNGFGLPTFLAMLVGFFWGDPIMMLTVQGFAFAGMILWIYWKTHFRDEYVLEKSKKD